MDCVVVDSAVVDSSVEGFVDLVVVGLVVVSKIAGGLTVVHLIVGVFWCRVLVYFQGVVGGGVVGENKGFGGVGVGGGVVASFGAGAKVAFCCCACCGCVLIGCWKFSSCSRIFALAKGGTQCDRHLSQKSVS